MRFQAVLCLVCGGSGMRDEMLRAETVLTTDMFLWRGITAEPS